MTLVPTLLISASLAVAPHYESAAPVGYLTDVASGATLYSSDASRRIPTASMAKMMTALVAFEAIKSGKLTQGQKFAVHDATWKRWNNTGSSMFLKANEEVSVDNLLHGMLTVSGNDAAVVLAEGIAGSEAAFAERMNAAARRIGMRDSHFGTANGWPDEGKTFSTARDLSLLAIRIITDHPELFRRYFGQREFSWNNVTQPNRNPLLGVIDGADGMKTGHSDEAGYCLTGTVKRGQQRLVMVLAGLPSQQARIAEARRLMSWGFEAWDDRPLFSAGKEVARAPVQLGNHSDVALLAPRDLAATWPKGASPKIKLFVRYNGPIRAPFRKGTELAQLIVKFPDGAQQVMPLVAAHSVSIGGFWDRAWNGAKWAVGSQ
jgi:serine-type D-Ala-D-Ala carboxypeptidase (penicillin-binding protein 5/6)